MSGYRTQRRIHLLCSILFCIGSLAVAGGVAFWPITSPEITRTETGSTSTTQTIIEKKDGMSADFVVPTAAGKLLQKPLEPIAESRPQVSVAPAVPSLPPLPDVELVGTAKDSDDRFSMAWLQLPNNKSPILARLGAQVDSIPGRPTVTAILDGKAILMFGPREKKLELKKNHLEK